MNEMEDMIVCRCEEVIKKEIEDAIEGGADTIDYKFNVYRLVDNTGFVLEDTIDLTHVGVANSIPNFETETVDGTNFSSSDKVMILLYMDQNWISIGVKI